jgi:hypothetical protein
LSVKTLDIREDEMNEERATTNSPPPQPSGGWWTATFVVGMLA